MDTFNENHYKFAKKVEPILATIVENVNKAVECVMDALKDNTNENDFSAFAKYVPITVKKSKTLEAKSYTDQARIAIKELKQIKASLRNPLVQIPNALLFDFIADGGIVIEIDDIFGFLEETRSTQPYIDYLDSVVRYQNEMIEMIKIGNDPDYYQYVKDSTVAKF